MGKEITIESFKTSLIKYYGEHDNEHVEKVTIAYVNLHYDKHNFENLLQAIMKSHPVKWGFPDVSAIEDSQDNLFKRENKSYKKVVLSSNSWEQDLSISDEEWKKGFKGMEKLKSAVHVGFEKAADKPIVKLDPEQMEQAKQELEEMK